MRVFESTHQLPQQCSVPAEFLVHHAITSFIIFLHLAKASSISPAFFWCRKRNWCKFLRCKQSISQKICASCLTSIMHILYWHISMCVCCVSISCDRLLLYLHGSAGAKRWSICETSILMFGVFLFSSFPFQHCTHRINMHLHHPSFPGGKAETIKWKALVFLLPSNMRPFHRNMAPFFPTQLPVWWPKWSMGQALPNHRVGL